MFRVFSQVHQMKSSKFVHEDSTSVVHVTKVGWLPHVVWSGSLQAIEATAGRVGLDAVRRSAEGSHGIKDNARTDHSATQSSLPATLHFSPSTLPPPLPPATLSPPLTTHILPPVVAYANLNLLKSDARRVSYSNGPITQPRRETSRA